MSVQPAFVSPVKSARECTNIAAFGPPVLPAEHAAVDTANKPSYSSDRPALQQTLFAAQQPAVYVTDRSHPSALWLALFAAQQPPVEPALSAALHAA